MNRRAVPLLLSGGLLTLSVGFPAPAPASDPVAPEGSELA